MIEIKSPHPLPERGSLAHLHGKTLFLAGSIEEGAAEPWQARTTLELANFSVTVYNPRRDAWDKSWKQSITNPQFKEQVEWELNAIDAADYVMMYIDPSTKSPITLLEFGVLWKSDKVLIGCPPGFWRRGNLEVMCNLRGLRLHTSLEELLETVKLRVS